MGVFFSSSANSFSYKVLKSTVNIDNNKDLPNYSKYNYNNYNYDTTIKKDNEVNIPPIYCFPPS
jgi:hypothetical protein